VNVSFIDDLEEYLLNQSTPFYFLSSKARTSYSQVSYSPSSILIFGSETSGLPEHFWQKWPDRFINIPMLPGARCLNLSNSVAIVLYEAWRQQDFRQSLL
jgi:tRNA (cytidine/uridine-2'-O-)-methyltransferase